MKKILILMLSVWLMFNFTPTISASEAKGATEFIYTAGRVSEAPKITELDSSTSVTLQKDIPQTGLKGIKEDQIEVMFFISVILLFIILILYRRQKNKEEIILG